MAKYLTLFCFLLFFNIHSYAQTGVNIKDNADAFSFLHINEGTAPSLKKAGLLLPQYTTTDRANIGTLSAIENGLTIFNTTDNCFNYWKQNTVNFPTGAWVSMCSYIPPLVFYPSCSDATISTNLVNNVNKTGTITVPIVVTYDGVINAISQVVNGISFTMPATTVTKSSTSIVINFTGAPSASGNFSLPIKDNAGTTICNINIPVS